MKPAAFGVETDCRRKPGDGNRIRGVSAAGFLETLIVADESVRLSGVLGLEGEIVLVDDVVEATAKNRGGEGHGLHVKGQGDRSDVKEAGDARGHKQIEIGGAGRQNRGKLDARSSARFGTAPAIVRMKRVARGQLHGQRARARPCCAQDDIVHLDRQPVQRAGHRADDIVHRRNQIEAVAIGFKIQALHGRHGDRFSAPGVAGRGLPGSPDIHRHRHPRPAAVAHDIAGGQGYRCEYRRISVEKSSRQGIEVEGGGEKVVFVIIIFVGLRDLLFIVQAHPCVNRVVVGACRGEKGLEPGRIGQFQRECERPLGGGITRRARLKERARPATRNVFARNHE